MKKGSWKAYTFWILLAELVGGLSGFLSRNGMEAYEAFVLKPPLSPPGLVFPIVWAILYALMGTGMARVWLTGPSVPRLSALLLFLLQLAVNFFWSPIFFNLQAFLFAFAWLLLLWVLVLLMTLRFRRLDRPAACLQIPYLLWVSFAAYLNLATALLNL